MSNEAGYKISEPTEVPFRGSKSTERDIENLTSWPAPRQFYEKTYKIARPPLIFTEILQNALLDTGSLTIM